MGVMLLIINPILLLVFVAFIDKDDVVIILGGRDVYVELTRPLGVLLLHFDSMICC